jgi:methylmalonyl-CoA/ethylmalonyl-CoA epimerase
MIGRLNHVAIAVPDLEAAAAQYRNTLGANVRAPQDEPDHGVTVVFIDLPNTKIELLYPLGENSPIKGFLEKNPSGGIHHICYEVDDILAARDHLKAEGARVLGTGSRRSARMASRCCSCTPRISTAAWSNWSRSDEPHRRNRPVCGDLVPGTFFIMLQIGVRSRRAMPET